MLMQFYLASRQRGRRLLFILEKIKSELIVGGLGFPFTRFLVLPIMLPALFTTLWLQRV